MLSIFKTLTFVFFLLLCPSAHAHIAGVTDTSVLISATGLKLVYTVPTDNLKEFNFAPDAESQEIEEKVLKGFIIQNNETECSTIEMASRSLTEIKSEQFEYKIDCGSPIKTLNIHYGLFFDVDQSHKNFVRISLLNRTQNTILSSDKPSHSVDVEKLVIAWDTMRSSNKPATELNQSSSHYFPVGVEHIIFGFDHLLFLLALLLLPLRVHQLLVLITTFTVAHSITLALSVLDVVTIPSRYVEAVIALSIVYVAVETMWVLRHKYYQRYDSVIWKRRLISTFLFGLIHGFGFSYILKTMGLGEQVARSLFFFNIGVEAGQIVAVIVAFPVLTYVFMRDERLVWAQLISAAVGFVGLYWLLERLSTLF